LNARVVLVALSLAGYGLFSTLANEWARPVAIQEATYGMSVEAPASLPRSVASLPRVIAALPTVTPPEESVAPRAGYAAASLPALKPLRAVTSLPTVTPLEPKEPERTGCDPAYPEERTCIPPGPPFDQGCAITSERRFEVLPPDPQGLDHDGDGIGCEPIRGST
jgi:micrococcal nuclease